MSTTTSPFTLRPDGAIVLPDEDGDPAYTLAAADALALEQFIAEHRDQIEDAGRAQRKISAYQQLAAHLAGGLPIPSYTTLDWDGRIIVHLTEDADYTAWADALTGEHKVDTHPTLGSRDVLTSTYFKVESPWAATEPVSA